MIDARKAPLVSHPVITIGIPAYNEEQFLERTIDSVMRQTWRDFAVLISDNASSDRTREIAEAAVRTDSRFHYHRHETNIGGVGNFNFLKDATESPLCMWLGGHDMMAPTLLERLVPPMIADPRYSIALGQTAWIDCADDVFRTSSGWMHTLPDIPLLRYALTPKKNDLCSEINNVLRRAFLDGTQFSSVWGTDNITIAHLAYRGPVFHVPEPLYLRRDLGHRREDYMKRLTGKDDVRIDFQAFIDAFITHLETIAPRGAMRPIAAKLTRLWLSYRYGVDRTGPAARLLGLAVAAKERLRSARSGRQS
jgi:glycosyltransferase involved in cell wall biosynthesis